jgi:aquaporin-4
LAFGLAVSTSVWSLSHVAGAGHVNPAVTVAMLVTGHSSLARAVLFVIAQCIGAVAGAGLLKGLTPAVVQASLGLPTVNRALNVEQAFGVEFIVTFALVLTAFASSDPDRPHSDIGPTAPLAIGMSVTSCHLFAVCMPKFPMYTLFFVSVLLQVAIIRANC